MHPSRSSYMLAYSLLAWASLHSASTQSTLDPYVIMEAEDWNASYGISIYSCVNSSACDFYIGNVNNGDFLVFREVDFQEGATGIELRVAADADKNDQVGKLNLHVDTITSSPFATVVIGNTGDQEGFVTIAQFIEYPPVGVRDLFLSFSTPFGDSDIGNIDWFQFYKVLPTSVNAIEDHLDASRDAFSMTMASEWNFQKGIENSECSNKNWCDFYAGYIQRDDVLGYYALDFQEGATGLEMALGANVKFDMIGTISFRLDNTSSYPFATVVTGNTGGEQKWTVIKQFIEYAPVGVHDLYFTFAADGTSDIGNIAWFQFFRVVEEQ